MSRGKEDGVGPITIQVERDRGGRTVSFLYQHCRRRHTHGVDGIEDGSRTHRLAHCWWPGSPFVAQGYHLKLAPGGRAVTTRAVAP